MSTVPRRPEGKYPQLELYGQLGIAPMSKSTRIISRIVPSDIALKLSLSGHEQLARSVYAWPGM
jgi:hypothetical protein